MGCLNAGQGFQHWFSNIHFSGPCNRACKFCIGQWMPGQDSNNNLSVSPLTNIDLFLAELREREIKEINLTGTNTDPMLYRYTPDLIKYLREQHEGVVIGVRTNGALILQQLEVWNLYDKASISITSFDKDIYKATMGNGTPPDIAKIVELSQNKNLKVNIVLTPEVLSGNEPDLVNTLNVLQQAGVTRVNLREPYGQKHIGDPVKKILGTEPAGERLGMSFYNFKGMDVMYWDVHYVHVESVNLYADGHISIQYPVTLGHSDDLGYVRDQQWHEKNYTGEGRQRSQWVGTSFEKKPLVVVQEDIIVTRPTSRKPNTIQTLVTTNSAIPDEKDLKEMAAQANALNPTVVPQVSIT